ncbi:MAG: GGDEF domain-containing protein, partial [Noviherbaspirillum sp.]
MPPTPDAYREIYDEVAGIREQSAAEKVLADFAALLANGPDNVAAHAHQVAYAVKVRDWQTCRKQLAQLAERHLEQAAAGTAESASDASLKADNRGEVLPAREDAMPLADGPEPRARSVPIPLADDPALPPDHAGSIALVDPEALPAETDAEEELEQAAPPIFGTPHSKLMREMLVRTWTLAVASLLQGAPELAKEAEAVANEIRLARSEKVLTDISVRLKQLCFRIELKSGDLAEEHELLLRLFRLLFENIGELVEDDSWLRGQIERVQELLSGPIDHTALMAVTHNLKDVIYKQGLLKHSLQEAKNTLKSMMQTFIDRLGAIAATTSSYHEKIDKYSQQIATAKDTVDLNKILDSVMFDTRVAQTEALRSREQMETVRNEVQVAGSRIQELEAELEQMSELAREDQLTGSLNRRGLDDVLEREIARSERTRAPLCVA